MFDQCSQTPGEEAEQGQGYEQGQRQQQGQGQGLSGLDGDGQFMQPMQPMQGHAGLLRGPDSIRAGQGQGQQGGTQHGSGLSQPQGQLGQGQIYGQQQGQGQSSGQGYGQPQGQARQAGQGDPSYPESHAGRVPSLHLKPTPSAELLAVPWGEADAGQTLSYR